MKNIIENIFLRREQMEDIISDLEDKNFEHRGEQTKKNKVKKTCMFYGTESKGECWNNWDARERRKEEGDRNLKEIMVENCPNLAIHIHKANRSSYYLRAKRPPKHNTIKLFKIKDIKRIPKVSQ